MRLWLSLISEVVKFTAQYCMMLISDLSTAAVNTKHWICAFFSGDPCWVKLFSIHNTEEEQSSIRVLSKSLNASAKFASSLHFCNISLSYQHKEMNACWDFTAELIILFFWAENVYILAPSAEWDQYNMIIYIKQVEVTKQMGLVFFITTAIWDSNENFWTKIWVWLCITFMLLSKARNHSNLWKSQQYL